MRYALLDLELTQPLPAVSLSASETGVGVLVRKRDRPIAFFLSELSAGASLAAEDVGRLVSECAAPAILEQALREELAEPIAAAPVSLTVAVCTRDRVPGLARCLASVSALRSEDPEDPRFFEILVVDNAPSDDAARALVESLAGVRYEHEPIPGLDVARNRALRVATGEFVAFLDDDVVVDRGWLCGIEEALAEHPDAAAVTGGVLPLELDSEAQIVFERGGGFRRGFAKICYVGQHLPAMRLYPVGAGIFGAGANMVLRRTVAAELGGFDEALDTGSPLPGGGDLDVFYRVVRAGHPLVYEPRMLVFHEHRQDHEALRRQYRSWGAGLMAFVGKTYAADPSQRPKLRGLVRWWFGAEAAELLRTLRGGTTRTPDLVLAELAGGVVGLLGTYPRSRRRMRRRRERFG